MSKFCPNSNGFAHILILLAVLGVISVGGAVGGAYYLGVKQQPSPSSLPSSSPVDLIIPSPEIAQTSVPATTAAPLLASTKPSLTALPIVIVSSSPNPIPAETQTVTTTLKKIPLMPTDNWQTVIYKGISFKISPEHRFQESEGEDAGFVWSNSAYATPLKITVTNYDGGSRRDQYYKIYPYAKEDCHQIYEEALFGNVKALQIAIDGSWCQGGGGGAIVVVVGSKLVILHDLSYMLETKEIYRWQFLDTLISTLKPVN